MTIRGGEPFTRRQQEVLEAALALLVRGQGRLTMTAVAAAASCSKETLYKWFGDRAGLLRATVRWQSSKVRVAELDSKKVDLAVLRERLTGFAADWLGVVSGENSIALNRLAIGQAGSGNSELGVVVLENGRFALAERLKPVLEAGRAAGLIEFADAEDAFRTFFGLVARDVQIRLLLGDATAQTAEAIAGDAERATDQFLLLYAGSGIPTPAGE
jgi:AcrR family transcriptional regulator